MFDEHAGDFNKYFKSFTRHEVMVEDATYYVGVGTGLDLPCIDHSMIPLGGRLRKRLIEPGPNIVFLAFGKFVVPRGHSQRFSGML